MVFVTTRDFQQQGKIIGADIALEQRNVGIHLEGVFLPGGVAQAQQRLGDNVVGA